MPILDLSLSTGDSSEADQPVDPAVNRLLESVLQAGEIEQSRQQACAEIPLPKANVDTLAIWFESNLPVNEYSHERELSRHDIEVALRDHCQPGDSKASLKLLDDQFFFLANIDSDPSSQKITSESMERFDSWIKADRAELEHLERVTPEQSAAIKFLHENFSALDGDENARLSDSELTTALNRTDLTPAMRLGLSLLDRNFSALAEPLQIPLSITALGSAVMDGPR